MRFKKGKKNGKQAAEAHAASVPMKSWLDLIPLSLSASTRASPVPYTLHSFSTRKISIPFSFLSITSITVSAGRSPRFCRLPASVCLRMPH